MTKGFSKPRLKCNTLHLCFLKMSFLNFTSTSAYKADEFGCSVQYENSECNQCPERNPTYKKWLLFNEYKNCVKSLVINYVDKILVCKSFQLKIVLQKLFQLTT